MSAFRQRVVPSAPLRLPVRGRTPTGLSWSQSPQASSPGFLIHDTGTLALWEMAGMRVAGHARTALELAANESQAHGFQYICTLNSDYVPRNEFSSSFGIEDCIRLRLTDADVAGCLMGVRV